MKNTIKLFGIIALVAVIGFPLTASPSTGTKEEHFGIWRDGDAIFTLSATECKFEYSEHSFTIASSTWKPIAASDFNVGDVEYGAGPTNIPTAAADNGYFIDGIIIAATGGFLSNGNVGVMGKFAIFPDKTDTKKAYLYGFGNGGPFTCTRK